jgi:hypothetical protein
MRKYILLIIVTVASCQAKKDAITLEKEENISSYYKNELHKDIPDNGMVVILQTQSCNACRKTTFVDFAKLIVKNKLPKTFILASYDTSLINTIVTIPNSNILIDSAGKVKAYGLNYVADLFFLFKDKQLKKWFEISNYTLENMKEIKE